ncbi:UPF0104 family protein [bacterium]|nr:UPF0104 family protein [bacterium]
MLKTLSRSLILFALAAGFLLLMQHFGLLRWASIVSAFREQPMLISQLVCIQVVGACVLVFRYWMILSVFGIRSSFRQITSATFVSSAVGQWAPGSLAIVELLRVGLMLGSHTSNSTSQTSGQEAGLKARLALVSLVDRMVGFFGILLMGFMFSGYLFLRMTMSESTVVDSAARQGVLMLWIGAGVGCVGLLSLPFLARLRSLRRLSQSLTGNASRRPKSVQLIARNIEAIRHNIEAGTRHPIRLFVPVALSMGSMLLACATLSMSARILASSLDFFQVVCVFPLNALAGLLPLGFAGIGGYQLVMASIFGIFSVSPAVVASAGVLQSALSLLVNSLLGLLFARVCSGQIRAILKRRSQPTVA